MPSSLKILEFNNHIDELEKGVLPLSLDTLKMRSVRTKLEKNILPNKLKNLTMEVYYSDFNLDVLPDTLETLYFNANEVKGFFPKNLTKLKCNIENLEILPKKLISLTINHWNKKLKIGDLPETLEELIINITNSNIEINESILPKNLKTLDLGNIYN